MSDLKIGIIADCFKIGLYNGIKKAAELGADGVQLYATDGELNPGISKQERKDLLNFIKDNGIVVSALCAEMGGFRNQIDNDKKIEKTKRIMDLGLELETSVTTAHIGVVPRDTSDDAFKMMQDIIGDLNDYGKKQNSYFAIETGPEKAVVLKTLLDSIKSTNSGINFDPANLVMVAEDDPIQAVYTLKDYIFHTHAKDGISLISVDPEKIYTGEIVIEDPTYEEKAFGQGDVDFPALIKAYKDIGYNGFMTIEREVGNQPEVDIKIALDFLKKNI